jgi:hypothetical protein
MEAVLSCIKLGAQVWRARPVVLFSSSLQEVVPILSSFILLSRSDLSLLLIFLFRNIPIKLPYLWRDSITTLLENNLSISQFNK